MTSSSPGLVPVPASPGKRVAALFVDVVGAALIAFVASRLSHGNIMVIVTILLEYAAVQAIMIAIRGRSIGCTLTGVVLVSAGSSMMSPSLGRSFGYVLVTTLSAIVLPVPFVSVFLGGERGSWMASLWSLECLTFAPRDEYAEASAPVAALAAPAGAEYPGASTSAPLKGVRKVVAKRMMESLTSTAQLTLNTTANAAGILAMRKKVKNADGSLGLNKITLNDLVCFAVSRTLPKYPVFNAHLEDGVLTEFEQVHLGFACDTPRGLFVPVIRSAQALGLKAFSDEAKRLASSAIDGTIAPDFLSGGTFTVSNIGSFGIETFTPVINLPQTAILGVGAITPRPTVAADGTIGVEQRLNLSLTIDHQVIDGADGARFLRDLVAAIENIDVTVLA